MINPETLATFERIVAGLEAEKPWEPVECSTCEGWGWIEHSDGRGANQCEECNPSAISKAESFTIPHPHHALWLAMTVECGHQVRNHLTPENIVKIPCRSSDATGDDVDGQPVCECRCGALLLKGLWVGGTGRTLPSWLGVVPDDAIKGWVMKLLWTIGIYSEDVLPFRLETTDVSVPLAALEQAVKETK